MAITSTKIPKDQALRNKVVTWGNLFGGRVFFQQTQFLIQLLTCPQMRFENEHLDRYIRDPLGYA